MFNANENDILGQVKSALEEVFGPSIHGWEEEVPIQNMEVRYDSATVMECLVVIEAKFNIKIDVVDDYPTETFVSLNTISKLVRRKLEDLSILG